MKRVILAVTVMTLCAHTALAQGGGGGGAAGRAGGGGGGGRGGGGRGGRGAIRQMTLTTTAWKDGGIIPVRYSQAGEEVSPPLAWTGAPDSIAGYVLVVHDLDAVSRTGFDDVLNWLVWNIPKTAKGLPEHVPQGPQLPDGSRQHSQTGPYYRGPAAPASGPVHHYAFEVYALDSLIDVHPTGGEPAATRTAVLAAMSGHVRGKGVLIGLFRRR